MKKKSKKKKNILSEIKWTCKGGLPLCPICKGMIKNNKCQDCGEY